MSKLIKDLKGIIIFKDKLKDVVKKIMFVEIDFLGEIKWDWNK